MLRSLSTLLVVCLAVHAQNWRDDPEAALAEAQDDGKPALVYVMDSI